MIIPERWCEAASLDAHCNAPSEIRAPTTDTGEQLALCERHYQTYRFSGRVGAGFPIRIELPGPDLTPFPGPDAFRDRQDEEDSYAED